MEILAAQWCGRLVLDRPWTGSVLSVHPGALNIRRRDGLLVSVVATPGAMTAMSVLAPGFSPRGGAGAPAQGDRSSIDVGGVVRIYLAAAETWSGRVPRGAAVEPETLDSALIAIRSLGRTEGLAPLLWQDAHDDRPVHHAARRALAAWSRGAGDLAPLVGLGPGLTPAGDDFLVGLFLAHELAKLRRLPGLSAACVTAADRKSVERGLAGTSAPGRTLLAQALARRFPAFLLHLVDALSRASTAEEAAGAIGGAAGHGGTSGSDAAAGFLWGATRLRQAPLNPQRRGDAASRARLRSAGR